MFCRDLNLWRRNGYSLPLYLTTRKATLCPQFALIPYDFTVPVIAMCVSSNYETYFEGLSDRHFPPIILQTIYFVNCKETPTDVSEYSPSCRSKLICTLISKCKWRNASFRNYQQFNVFEPRYWPDFAVCEHSCTNSVGTPHFSYPWKVGKFPSCSLEHWKLWKRVFW